MPNISVVSFSFVIFSSIKCHHSISRFQKIWIGKSHNWLISLFFKFNHIEFVHVKNKGISDHEILMIDSSIDKHIPVINESCRMTPSAENCRIVQVKSCPDVLHSNFFWILNVLNSPINIQAPHVASSFLVLHFTSWDIGRPNVVIHLSSHERPWSRYNTWDIAMLSSMNIAWIHHLLPFSLNDVINPQIPQYFSVRPFSSEHDQVVIVAEHDMPSSWRRSLPKVLHLLPRIRCILVLVKIIQIVLLVPHEVPSPKYPDPVDRILARRMVFPCHEPVWGRLNTHNSEGFDGVESGLNEASKVANLVVYLELDSAIEVYLAEVVNDEPVPGLVCGVFYQVHLFWLDGNVFCFFPGYVHFGI